MRKKLITGAIAACLLLGICVTAFAAEKPRFPFAGDRVSKMEASRATREVIREDIKEALNEKLANLKKEVSAAMSAYEQYGLVYNQDKGAYYYEGKLVSLFVDAQGMGASYLSKNGEVHLKAIRDDSGALTGLAELSEEEYSRIVAELKSIKADLQEHASEMRSKIREQMQSEAFEAENFKEGYKELRKSLKEQREQLRKEMKGRWSGVLNTIE